MPSYRRKPVVVEAVRFEGFVDPRTDVPKNAWPVHWDTVSWRRATVHKPCCRGVTGPLRAVDGLRIPNAGGGTAFVEPGDWVVRSQCGSYFSCKPDVFARNYELVKE